RPSECHGPAITTPTIQRGPAVHGACVARRGRWLRALVGLACSEAGAPPTPSTAPPAGDGLGPPPRPTRRECLATARSRRPEPAEAFGSGKGRELVGHPETGSPGPPG